MPADGIGSIARAGTGAVFLTIDILSIALFRSRYVPVDLLADAARVLADPCAGRQGSEG